MKTAIQQAIEDDFEFAGTEKMSGYEVVRILKGYLAKEKQQIIDAFDVGNKNEKYRFESKEQYYNETFKND